MDNYCDWYLERGTDPEVQRKTDEITANAGSVEEGKVQLRPVKGDLTSWGSWQKAR